MSWRIPELLDAILLAFAFTCLGDWILRRISRNMLEANQSFLVGLAVCAGALFVASVLLPHRALLAIALLLAVAAAGWLIRSKPGADASGGKWSMAGLWMWLKTDRVRALLLLLVLGLIVAYGVLNFRLSYLWDGFQIWASKAMVLYHQGGLTRRLWPSIGPADRFASYPPAVPLYEGLLAYIRGEFDFNSLKPVFLIFYCSLLMSIFQAASALVSLRLALTAVLIVGALPMLCTGQSIGGYADMPLACYVAATCGAFLSRRDPSSRAADAWPWLAGGLTMVKSEGVVLVAVIVGIVVFDHLRSGWTGLLRFWNDNRKSAAIVLSFVGLQLCYHAWTGVRDPAYAAVNPATIRLALGRIGEVFLECSREMTNVPKWGLLWIALPVVVLVVLWLGEVRTKQLTACLLAALGCYGSIYLFTNWSVTLHIGQSFDRLLSQVAPAAAVLTVYSYSLLGRRLQPHRDGRLESRSRSD